MATKPKKRRKLKGLNANGTAQFDIQPQRVNGRKFTIWCCRRCTRAWRFADPVEGWRIKNLLNHAGGHVTDNALTELRSMIDEPELPLH
jgi:hypothetical protein